MKDQTEPKAKKELDSNDLFPSMMQATKLLILDYDVTRYHSFDMFRYLLMDEIYFQNLDQALRPFVTMRDIGDQIMFYKHNCMSLCPYDNFSNSKGSMKLTEYEDQLNESFNNPILHRTPTDLDKRLGVAFDKSSISGYLLKYTKDPHIPPYADKLKVYTTDHVLDLRMAMAIIFKQRINAIIVSSVDIAVAICLKMKEQKDEWPVSFIIGSYLYNYDPELQVMRHIPEMNVLEYYQKHEFGIFEPYSGLEELHKQQREAEQDE